MKKLRIGIIGLGVGMNHFLAYQQHPGCKVAAVCDFSDDKLLAFHREYAQIRCARDADDLLFANDIDLVSIASFDNYHCEHTVAALKNNKHVFVEKPVCLHYNEADSIRRMMQEKPYLKLSSNFTLRACPRFRELKTAIRSGRFGDIYYLEGDYLWGRVSKLLDGWRKDIPFYSIVHGAAVHMIDLVLWLVEDLPVEVFGYGNNLATRESNFRFNDFAAMIMRFGNGAVAKISANGGCVHPHFHKLVVYGTKRSFSHELLGARLITRCEGTDNCEEVTTEYPGNRKMKIIHSFVDSILQKDLEPLVPASEIFKTLSVCFAAEKSIQQAKPVKIAYLS